MTIYDVENITIPEDFVIIEMTYKQFRKFYKGIWQDSTIFRTEENWKTKEKRLYAFHGEKRKVLVCRE